MNWAFSRVRVGLSPRGRGKPLGRQLARYRAGSIPAWAGETRGLRMAAANPGVYPRVGGGNASSARRGLDTGGLSPRGRGKH